MKKALLLIVLLLFAAGCANTRNAGNSSPEGAKAQMQQRGPKPIPDPLEPMNRVFFVFNDKLYFWVLKPVAQGYSAIVPKIARRGVGNFFSNLGMPIRAVNCLLQGDISGTGIELGRFGVNTTVGVLGFGEVATGWGLKMQKEDFGQTLGFYGMPPLLYLVWPVLGSSSVRGTIGKIADGYLYPPNYVDYLPLYDKLNYISLHIGDYEGIKEDALDPYVAIRNGYHQHRQHLIRDGK
ncbi:MAG: VacJ family lipoprotein [Planctomycetes bacterium]|nr:VacJ family lipoprotein [Planctomycetota bacterium]